MGTSSFFSPETFFSSLCFHTSTHFLHLSIHRHLPRCGSILQRWKQILLPPTQNAMVLLQLTHFYFNTSNKFYKTLTPVSPYFYTHPTHKICNTSPLSSSKSTTASSSPQHKKCPVHFILPPLSTIFVPTMKKFADVRSKGSVCFAGCLPDTASAAVQVLGMALRLLSLHARRRLQSRLTLWLEAGKRNNRRVQPRFRIRCPPAGEGTEDTGRALYRPGAMRDQTGEGDRHQEHTFCHQVTARQRGHLRKGRTGYLSGRDIKEVSKAELLQRTSTTPAVFNGLIDRGVFEVYQQEIGRIDKALLKEVVPVNPLNEHQQRAYHAILENFQSKNVCLLHGITASGKTEVYIHLIEETIREGKQVLYLLPEIALTAQITERLQRVFGSRLGIYHSKFPDAERVEIWQKQLSEADYDIILGVRSSVFLPFRNLGLVIVDEEHENTYKQQDPAPRYHARNAAIVLASMYGAKTLLGTATPSVETWHNATSGKYGLVELKERYKEIQLPEIIPVDIKPATTVATPTNCPASAPPARALTCATAASARKK